MVLKNLNDLIGRYSGLSRKVLDYSMIMKSMVGLAKKPGFSIDSWAPLAELVDTERFERVGNFKEVMNWNQYLGFLTAWASNSEWDCSFKRITESGNVVFLELEERSKVGAISSVVNSVSVYEFGSYDKIEHVDIYLQMEIPASEMLDSYSGMVL